MNFREITLFSVKEISDITLHFNRFAKSVQDLPYKLEYGAYESLENRNRGYNYLLKITSDNNSETFIDGEFKTKYKLFLEEISSLNKNETFSLAYKPSQQLINKKNLQAKPKVNHIVFFEFKENCINETIDEVFNKLTALFPNVDGIVDFRYGKRLNASNLANEYVFEMQFLDVAARDEYLKQKEHEEVVEFIIPLLKNGEASVIAFDYKLPMPKFEGQHHLAASGLFSAPTDSADRTTESQETEERQVQGYRS